MRVPLRQYRQAHRETGFPLEAVQAWIAEHGPPDLAEVRLLSERLALPTAAIRSAISYYTDLHEPQRVLRVCNGTSCLLGGAEPLQQRLAERVPCGSVYCLGYCDRSPAALRADGRALVHCDPRLAGALPLGAEPVADPPPPSIRTTLREPIVMRNAIAGDFSDLTAARSRGVYAGVELAIKMSPESILSVVEKSGERGRGGAGFPTAAKWRACAAASGDAKYVVANGDEGDPGAFVDRVLMEQDPHSILEGMILCARAVGAHHGIVFIRSEYPRAIACVARAIRDARAAGILGPSVMQSGFAFDATVFPGMGSYVCGEETAMLNAIEGLRGEVRLRPPFPASEGLFGRPTVVNNVETLINISWIIQRGPEAYRALGTPECSGTKALCFNHGFAQPGIVEVAFGVSLRHVVEQLAGGACDARPLAAVLLGGPMGSVLTPEEWDVPVCYDAMGKRGVQLGHGGIVAVPEGTDFRRLMLHWLQFMQRESCGKCVPCRTGSLRALERVEHSNGAADAAAVHRLLDVMADASLCAFGQQMPGPMRKMLQVFGNQIFSRGDVS